jgi:hypothetical protein
MQPLTSVDVIGATLVCPVGTLEHAAGKDVDGVGHPDMGTMADAGGGRAAYSGSVAGDHEDCVEQRL